MNIVTDLLLWYEQELYFPVILSKSSTSWKNISFSNVMNILSWVASGYDFGGKLHLFCLIRNHLTKL